MKKKSCMTHQINAHLKVSKKKNTKKAVIVHIKLIGHLSKYYKIQMEKLENKFSINICALICLQFVQTKRVQMRTLVIMVDAKLEMLPFHGLLDAVDVLIYGNKPKKKSTTIQTENKEFKLWK